MENNIEETEVFICDCHSMEHQIKFYEITSDYPNGIGNKVHKSREIYGTIHLTTYKNFFKRCWYAIKYVFGFKSRFGAWDEFCFKDKDIKKFQEFLNSNYPTDK